MIVRKDYLPLFRQQRWKERFRSWFVRSAVFFPPTFLSLRAASYVLCANRDTLDHISPFARHGCSLLLETALDVKQIEETQGSPDSSGDDLVALWVGSIEPRKGLELGLRAIAQVQNVRLEIIGSGDEQKYLEKLAIELGIDNRISWRGRLSHDEILPSMAKADMFLFTSVRDTSGNVVLEAMSSGLPVVAINHQGVADILDSNCGILINPGSIESTVEGFANAMNILLNDSKLRTRLGQNGKTRLSEQFGWRSNRDKMNEVYNQVVAGLH